MILSFYRSLQFWKDPTKIVYRKVSSIIVILVADESESELGLLDLIQVLMQIKLELKTLSVLLLLKLDE